MKKKLLVIFIVVSLVLSVGIILYPPLSTAYHTAHQSQLCIRHRESVEQAPDHVIAELREAAEAYNASLQPIAQENFTPENLEEFSSSYARQLNLAGDGIMGYVDIPKIQVYLPIYHGTGDNTLELGVGHLLGSSLPIGGLGTHAILTAHSGMASQKMFSDLPQLQTGDTFYLHVLDEILAYQVDAIHTVLPYNTTYLGTDSQRDFCTLVTCTPFGVNTHRLLVRGSRIPYTKQAIAETLPAASEAEGAGSNWEREYLKGILCGLALVPILLGLWGGVALWRKHHAAT